MCCPFEANYHPPRPYGRSGQRRMTLLSGNSDSKPREAPKYKTECIQAVLAAHRHLALEISSAEDLQEYCTDGRYFTLSRVDLEPGRKRGAEVHLKIHVRPHPDRSAAEALYHGLRPADAVPRPQDLQGVWVACLSAACRRGVAPYAFTIGPQLAIVFTRETTRQPGPAPLEDRLVLGAAAAAALDPPDWQAVERSSDYKRAETIWNYCLANDCGVGEKVTRVWEMWERIFHVKRDSSDGAGAS